MTLVFGTAEWMEHLDGEMSTIALVFFLYRHTTYVSYMHGQNALVATDMLFYSILFAR